LFNNAISKFNSVANIIQAIYGAKRTAAYLETLFAYIIVVITAISRNKISINPDIGDFKPKNKKDHNALSIN
jgi:hypothetical protein